MNLSQENLIFMIKICEWTERFEEMFKYMKQYIHYGDELSEGERNLLSIACTNIIGSKRTSWKVLQSLEQREERKGSPNTHLVRNLKNKVIKEMQEFCEEVVSLIDNSLLKSCCSGKSKAYFLKMKGDYYIYIAECSDANPKSQIQKEAHQAYIQALDTLDKDNYPKSHPSRLSIILNFSIFCYEFLNDPEKACQLSKTALENAIPELENLRIEEHRDSTCILSMIRDNLTLWTEKDSEE